MLGINQEMENFHLVVNDDDGFMTNLVRGHEEIHVYVEHPVDDPILVDEGDDIGKDVQPLLMEKNLIGYYNGDDSDEMYANDDIFNNEDEPIEVDVE